MNALKDAPDAREGPPAIKILAAYLAISSVPAIFALADHRDDVALVHLAAFVIVAVVAVSRQTGAVVDWLPLVAIPFLYAELPRLAVGGLHDGAVQRWESAVFGTSPAHTLAARWPNALFSESVHAAYLSYYLIIYGPPIVLYLRGRLDTFRSTVAGLLAIFAICYTVFLVFPVAGPRYEWSAPPAVFDGPIRRLALRILAAGSSRGTAFPSSHVAVATVQSILAFRWSVRAGLSLGALTSCLAVGAVYGGFHYGIDVLAGAGLGLAVGFALLFAYRDPLVQPLSSISAPAHTLDESAGDAP